MHAADVFDVSSLTTQRIRWREGGPLKCADVVPSARCSHSVCAIDDSSFVLVGGGLCDPEGEWQHTNDFWLFDAKNCSYSRLDSDDSEGERPCPRRGHTTGYDQERGHVLIFGGTSGATGEAGLLNDVWLFHVSSRTWSKPALLGDAPSPRRGSAGWLCNGHFYIFGGHSTDLDVKVWGLNLCDMTWGKIEYGSPNTFRSRSGQTAVIRDDWPGPHVALSQAACVGSQVFFFGGCDANGRIISTLFRLDTKDWTWFIMEVLCYVFNIFNRTIIDLCCSYPYSALEAS